MNSSMPAREPASSPRDEEFNPLVVYQVIRRRKAMFFFVFLAVVLTGGIMTLFSVPKASYVTVLQIGSAYGNDSLSGKLVEDADGVATKLERSVIPEVTRSWRSEKPARMVPKLTVKAKRNAGVILLMSQAPVSRQADVSQLHQAVVRPIVEAHRSLVTTQYEAIMSQARRDLVKSQAQLDQLSVALSEQKQRKELLARQLRRLNADIESISATRMERDVPGEEKNDHRELYLTQLDLPAMLERRDSLEEELNIALDLEIADIRQKISNAESERDAAEKHIEQLQREMDSLRLTRVQSLASPMPDKVGLSPALMLVMSLILGLLLAWFTVMFVEYLARKSVWR